MKKCVTWLILTCMSLAITAIFTGCEPNVPENKEGENAITTLQPNNNNNEPLDTDDENNNDNDGDLEDEFEGENEGENEDEESENNGTSAAEGNTSAADFDNHPAGEATGDDHTLPLRAVQSVQCTASGTSGVSGVFDCYRSLSTICRSPATVNCFTHLPNSKIGWGLGSQTDDRNRPVDAVNANEKFKSLGATFIGEREPIIYLTFDEGYENGCSSAILDTLKSRNVAGTPSVKATFFVTYDYCKSEPELVQRMIDEGHVIGNHSYSHPSFPDCTVEQMQEEIGKLHDYVKQTFNYEMNLIRFPMGEFSERCLAVAQDMGYTSVFWSFAYIDWNVNNQPEPAKALEKIKAGTHPGAIVLLHAVSHTNAAILGDVLDYWHSNGYRLGLIDENENQQCITNDALLI